ncbi:sialate O-acetylesterase [Fulvivirga ligni]|uniref:sialate O-acetylesterase n=1 Tax=Fulvivirga ligni TaxID=2904246 RepID=UPI001F31FB64|nr:sialate O-acetylesterase [Fulvivirga ligni]UII20908.1 sialate O-acetylesterase [Fulvivirga ligni]
MKTDILVKLKSNLPSMPRLYLIVLFSLIFITAPSMVSAQLSLPEIFSDNMVLQRDKEIPLWGSAAAGSLITVELNGVRQSTTSNADKSWELHFPKQKAGGPHLLTIYQDSIAAISFKNVLIGDVWVASGQSNMEWQVQQAKDASEEIKNAQHPEIRYFKVDHAKRTQPQADVAGGSWQAIDSNTVKEFSAVAYYFSRKIQKDINIPIGIIQSTWGGTPVEAWTSKEQLLSSPAARNRTLANDTISEEHFVKDSLDLIRFWNIVYTPEKKVQKEIIKRNYNDEDWSIIKMPSTLKDGAISYYEGIVWLRKEVTIPQSMMGKDLTISLGHPEMNYTLFFNEERICKNVWNANETHDYPIPKTLAKKHKNIITIRMAYLWGGGGFNPPADEMYISDGDSKITLSGDWKYKKGLEPAIPEIMNYHQYPSFLYNGMINPIIPYGIKGFIWYQGENNVEAASDYAELFSLLISDWRIKWQQGYLPFIYVQLANYMKENEKPSESDWALLREAQTKTLKQPNTAMACIIDIGEAASIHPLNKQEVGRRLALLAESMVYQQKVQAYGPIYKNHKIEKGKIIISFSEIADGLAISEGTELKGFAIAGADQKFYWAKAEIRENEIVVSSDDVPNPIVVRYNWADNPNGNLTNSSGLPAIPFRTDDWVKKEKSGADKE